MREIPPHFMTLILQRSQCNPLTMRELVYALKKQELLDVRSDGKLQLAAPLQSFIELHLHNKHTQSNFPYRQGDEAIISVPVTIQCILGCQIDKVTHVQRMLLKCAAVIGDAFSSSLIEAVYPLQAIPEQQMADELAELQELDLIVLCQRSNEVLTRALNQSYVQPSASSVGGALKRSATTESGLAHNQAVHQSHSRQSSAQQLPLVNETTSQSQTTSPNSDLYAAQFNAGVLSPTQSTFGQPKLRVFRFAHGFTRQFILSRMLSHQRGEIEQRVAEVRVERMRRKSQPLMMFKRSSAINYHPIQHSSTAGSIAQMASGAHANAQNAAAAHLSSILQPTMSGFMSIHEHLRPSTYGNPSGGQAAAQPATLGERAPASLINRTKAFFALHQGDMLCMWDSELAYKEQGAKNPKLILFLDESSIYMNLSKESRGIYKFYVCCCVMMASGSFVHVHTQGLEYKLVCTSEHEYERWQSALYQHIVLNTESVALNKKARRAKQEQRAAAKQQLAGQLAPQSTLEKRTSSASGLSSAALSLIDSALLSKLIVSNSHSPHSHPMPPAAAASYDAHYSVAAANPTTSSHAVTSGVSGMIMTRQASTVNSGVGRGASHNNHTTSQVNDATFHSTTNSESSQQLTQQQQQQQQLQSQSESKQQHYTLNHALSSQGFLNAFSQASLSDPSLSLSSAQQLHRHQLNDITRLTSEQKTEFEIWFTSCCNDSTKQPLLPLEQVKVHKRQSSRLESLNWKKRCVVLYGNAIEFRSPDQESLVWCKPSQALSLSMGGCSVSQSGYDEPQRQHLLNVRCSVWSKANRIFWEPRQVMMGFRTNEACERFAQYASDCIKHAQRQYINSLRTHLSQSDVNLANSTMTRHQQKQLAAQLMQQRSNASLGGSSRTMHHNNALTASASRGSKAATATPQQAATSSATQQVASNSGAVPTRSLSSAGFDLRLQQPSASPPAAQRPPRAQPQPQPQHQFVQVTPPPPSQPPQSHLRIAPNSPHRLDDLNALSPVTSGIEVTQPELPSSQPLSPPLHSIAELSSVLASSRTVSAATMPSSSAVSPCAAGSAQQQDSQQFSHSPSAPPQASHQQRSPHHSAQQHVSHPQSLQPDSRSCTPSHEMFHCDSLVVPLGSSPLVQSHGVSPAPPANNLSAQKTPVDNVQPMSHVSA